MSVDDASDRASSHVDSQVEHEELPDALRRAIATHHALYRRDPESAHWWDPIVVGVPGGPVACLLLHHVGRRSGQWRDSILQYYRDGDDIAIVGSKGGVARHPAWYLNLLAHPKCISQIGARRTATVARAVQGDERAQWWARITREQPVQLEYQARTSREIPVVVLEPDPASRAL